MTSGNPQGYWTGHGQLSLVLGLFGEGDLEENKSIPTNSLSIPPPHPVTAPQGWWCWDFSIILTKQKLRSGGSISALASTLRTISVWAAVTRVTLEGQWVNN